VKSRTLTCAVALILLAAVPTALASTTWYVNGVTGRDSNNCKSPTTACKTIGHAVSIAVSGDTIIVAAATYQENLTIGKSLKVIGSGASTTIIDGGRFKRVFTISTGVTVTLMRVTIQNGSTQQSGGGIYNSGQHTISTSTISGNTAFLGSCSHSCVSSGGGIYNTGVLTISTSTISGNTAGDGAFIVKPCGYGCSRSGGGIYNLGVLTIINSTIAGNAAIAICASARCDAFGGGIANGTNATLTINNSTLSGNVAEARCKFVPPLLSCPAGGGGIDTGGTLIINNSTLSGNAAYPTGDVSRDVGGEIFGGPATLQNSIVANSTSGGNCNGSITSKGYNLSSDGSCSFKGPGDMNNINPVLGKLGNYGGPTQTIPLLSGSPAIDAGNPSGCTDGNGHLLKTDQRGMPRPDTEDKTGCDMGAYERQGD